MQLEILLLPSPHRHQTIAQPAPPDLQCVQGEDAEVPQTIHGTAPERNGLVHQVGVLVIVGPVTVVAKIAGLENDLQDPPGFRAQRGATE